MTDAATATVLSPRQKAARISLLSVLYLAFGHLSFLPLVQNVLVTPAVFYSEGIALAFVLRYGAWVWPGIFLGQLALALVTACSASSGGGCWQLTSRASPQCGPGTVVQFSARAPMQPIF